MRFLELKIPPPVVLLATAGSMWFVSVATPSWRFPFPGHVVAAAVLGAIGLLVNVSGVLSFRRARTTVNPLKPDTASSLVAEGIYRVTRNPMYLGFLSMLLGWSSYLANALSLPIVVFFVAYITRFQILPEERALERVFKQDYVAYKEKVRRWL
jgi:protein-S-isoprenylcysteine O-methyltransferase Ste14